MLKWISRVFVHPTDEEIARADLAEARREHLVASKHREHAEHLEMMYAVRIERLRQRLGHDTTDHTLGTAQSCGVSKGAAHPYNSFGTDRKQG